MLPLSLLMLADWRLYSVVPILYPLYRPMRAQQHRHRAYVVVVDLFLDPGEFQWLITMLGNSSGQTFDQPRHDWFLVHFHGFFRPHACIVQGFIQINLHMTCEKRYPFLLILWWYEIGMDIPPSMPVTCIFLQVNRESIRKEFMNIDNPHPHFFMFGVMVLPLLDVPHERYPKPVSSCATTGHFHPTNATGIPMLFALF